MGRMWYVVGSWLAIADRGLAGLTRFTCWAEAKDSSMSSDSAVASVGLRERPIMVYFIE